MSAVEVGVEQSTVARGAPVSSVVFTVCTVCLNDCKSDGFHKNACESVRNSNERVFFEKVYMSDAR